MTVEFVDVMVRAEDEAAFWTAAVAAGLAEAPGGLPASVTLDVLGAVPLAPPGTDEDDGPLPVAFRPGWHANLRFRLPAPEDDAGERAHWAAVRDFWLAEGAPADPQRAEAGVTLLGVTFITGGVATPARIFI